ncbi:MAG: TetR/AcrR family transcriptional regulator [Cellulomonadaceae bacterium]
MTVEQEQHASRPRGRPRHDGPHQPITRDAIIDAALGIASAQGFSALTMRSLASELEVTVRALYRHVADRQEVIDLLAARIMDLQPEHVFAIEDWRSGIRTLYRETRDAYRLMGRAMLFAFEETVSPAELPVKRILFAERLLVFLTGLGLELEDAIVWRQQFLTDVFGYTLLIDQRYDHATDAERRTMAHPVPRPWLDAHPAAEAPLSRQALLLAPPSPDEVFERTIDRAILAIEARKQDHAHPRT